MSINEKVNECWAISHAENMPLVIEFTALEVQALIDYFMEKEVYDE